MALPEEQPVRNRAQGLRRDRLTAAEYRRIGETGVSRPDVRIELIDGEIVDIARTGSRHAGVVRHLARLLERAMGDAAVVSVHSPVALSERSEPAPDIALLRPRADFYKGAHPQPADVLLIIEVADASLRYDRQIKLPLYARYGIVEVWLVDLESDTVTSFSRPANGVYPAARPVDVHTRATLAGVSNVTLDFGAVLAR